MTLGLVALTLEQFSLSSPPPLSAARFAIVALLGVTGAFAGAGAAVATAWLVGPGFSERKLAALAVFGLFGGALLGAVLNHWDRPTWHVVLSIAGGAIVGVLLVTLFVLREPGIRDSMR
jgi:hypothetical protein